MEERKLKVLYVDDETDLLTIGKLFMERFGNLTVDTSPSASEALSKIASGSFDGIVSDYQMPGMDGIQLLQEVRQKYGDIPFILFTGRGREEVVIQAIDLELIFTCRKEESQNHSSLNWSIKSVRRYGEKKQSGR